MGLDMMIFGRTKPALPAPPDAGPDYEKAAEAIALRFDPEVKEEELAYWRKHPNLHGYIVQTYADGVDECQEIPLNEADLRQILAATQEPGSLPPTAGFFFGESDGSEAEDDKVQLLKVLEWLAQPPEGTVREVFYASSW